MAGWGFLVSFLLLFLSFREGSEVFEIVVDLALQFALAEEIHLALQLKQEAFLAIDLAAKFAVFVFKPVEPFFYRLKELCHFLLSVPEFGEVDDGERFR